MFCDSMITLHKISQITRSCLCIEPLVSATARGTFSDSCASPVKCLFYTDKPGSIEWQDPVPRKRIDGCFVIHLPSLRTL